MVEEIAREDSVLETCPAFNIDEDGLPVVCGAKLRVMQSRVVIGDDYGSWAEHDVYFDCGHDLRDMKFAARISEYI